VVAVVQAEVLPYDKNYLRHGDRLAPALEVLNDVWSGARASLFAVAGEAVRARQAAAMTAVARWMYTSALARTETRGMHKRGDFPAVDPAQHHRLISGGLDRVWVTAEPTAPETEAKAVLRAAS
jgi:succinate dehydrogenase/fumarate reductase flavoprotein subunit